MAASPTHDKITTAQQEFYNQNRQSLIDEYLGDLPRVIDPDVIRDLFIPIGYDRTNVQKFQGICKRLTADIFDEVLTRNKGRVRKVIFAAGLPATGKSTHLRQIAGREIIYDGTINNEAKFIGFVEKALNLGFEVQVFIYSANPARAFASNLNRGDTTGRYVPISQYAKVAASINKRQQVLKKHFQDRVKFRNFDHTDFKGKLKKFSKITIDRNELKAIARKHKFPDDQTIQKILD